MKNRVPMIAALLAVSAAVPLASTASSLAPQERRPLDDKVIGWGPIRPPKGNAANASAFKSNAAYTPGKRKLLDTFQGWIQKSYTPIGRLAEPWKIMAPASATNSEQPPRWAGLQMMMWRPALTATGAYTRAQPASEDTISVAANETVGFESAFWFNTPKQFYFTMEVDRDGNLLNEEAKKKYGPVVEEITKKLTTGPDPLAPGTFLVLPASSNYINVILIPGGKLPVVPVSYSEAFRVFEEGCRRATAKGQQPERMLTNELKLLSSMREKYKDNLNEPATVHALQVTIYTFDTEMDPFEKKPYWPTYPLYRYAPETVARCRTDAPQWIVVRFPNNIQGRPDYDAIWKAMTEKFNYAYVYNTFFAPEKVKGQVYHPRGG